ncbi:MAG: ABC transporter permease [Clostridia bacterium]|nr:ABC transporter permease [Clostridia bacterium]
MSAIYKRELHSYFCGMTGPIFTAFLLLMTGIYMTVYNLMGGYPNFEVALSGVSFVFLIAVPVLTMRSMAEEKHSRTDQLLYALPVSLSSVVMAKYLAMVTVLALPVGVMCFYPLILGRYGTVGFASAYGSILAFFLLGCALIAIGMFISSLTESQVIAAVISVGVLLLTYLMAGLAGMLPETAGASFAGFLVIAVLAGLVVHVMVKNSTVSMGVTAVFVVILSALYFFRQDLFAGALPELLEALALFDRMYSFTNGIFDLTAIVYYLTVAALFVYLTVQSMDKKRWS